VSFYDELYLTPSWLQRARAAQALGRPDEAKAAYRRVLDLWSSADPEMSAWVEEARAQTAR